MNCPERARLTEDFTRALENWSNLVQVLDLRVGTPDFDMALAQVAAARAVAKGARNALEEHRAAHGC